MENKNVFATTLFAILLGISLVSSAFIVSNTIYDVKNLNNTLEVTGSTRYKVRSDTVEWKANVTRTVKMSDLKNGYTQIANDINNVIAFYKSNGIQDTEIKTYPVSVNQDWSYTKTSDQKPEDQMYILSQVIEVDSSSVDAISNLSKDASKLASINALYSTQSVEYYYSGLPELRINLLSDAIKDAKLRAQKIAESNNQTVGSLRSASMGSVLVLAPNANVEDGSWGSYDTSTIDKEVMVTVRASFLIK
ncbi:MAG TPA: SIMPL domain-containing protein [bacterium]|nr:SIMPL domain-containing protein [bacterium]